MSFASTADIKQQAITFLLMNPRRIAVVQAAAVVPIGAPWNGLAFAT
jgi:hypothetical protein